MFIIKLAKAVGFCHDNPVELKSLKGEASKIGGGVLHLKAIQRCAQQVWQCVYSARC